MIVALAALAVVIAVFVWWRSSATRASNASSAFPRDALAGYLLVELIENRNKTEAFIAIYTDMLKKLRALEIKAAYEETGDFIHRFVPLNRSVYELYQSHTSALGAALEKDLANVYARIQADTVYDQLTPQTPRGLALQMVEKIVDQAENLRQPLESLIQRLQMIQRDAARAGK